MNSNGYVRNVIVSNIWSNKNKGDLVLSDSIFKMVKDIYPNVKISGITFCSSNDNMFAEDFSIERENDIEILGAMYNTNYMRYSTNLYFNTIKSLISFFAFLLRCALCYVCKDNSYKFVSKKYKKSFEAVKDADIFFVKGGGYITSCGGFLSEIVYLYKVLSSIIIGVILEKKIIICGASVWDIRTSIAKKILRWILNRCECIILREEKSYDYLKNEIGCQMDHVSVKLDFAFYLKKYANTVSVENKNRNGIQVGLTIREYFKTDIVENYYLNIRLLIKSLIEEGITVFLIPQVVGPGKESDLKLMNRLYSDINHSCLKIITKELSVDELLKIYNSMNLVIGTRFHSVIFSLLMGTPVLSIAYEKHKSHGIMDMMRLNEFVFDYECLNVKDMMSKIYFIIDHENHLRESINERLNDLVDTDYLHICQSVKDIGEK